jgi:hypothetical protein
MAVTKTFSRKPYIGTGSAVEFSFASKVFALTDVSVIVKNLTTGIETTLTVDVDYTIVAISGNLDNGVTIDTTGGSTPVIYTTNDQITLIRSISETQTLELEEGGDMPANELEDALDRCVMISQQNADDGGRHLSHPATDPVGLSYEAPTVELRKGKAAGWDATTGAIVALSIADEGGAFTAVNTNKGLSASAGTISGEVDDVTLEFDGNGDFSIKDLGVDTAQLAANSVTADKLPLGALVSAYPVGSIYMNAGVATNPSTLLGFGTWTAFGAGKVVVGIDVGGDADFDTLEETGGAKTHTLTEAEMPAHTHDYSIGVSDPNEYAAGSKDALRSLSTTSTTSAGGDGAHNNVQPYIVVHMWKRTA